MRKRASLGFGLVPAAGLLALAACTGPAESGPDRESGAALPAGFAATGETRRCLPVSAIAERRVLGRESLLFRLSDGRSYRNRLPYSCPGLTRVGDFRIRATGGRLCSEDSVQVAAASGPGALCGLGAFERLRPLREERAVGEGG